MSAPGAWLRAAAARCCRASTMERLVDPIVADLQAELGVLGDRPGWRRRRLLWSTYAGFWKALTLHLALSVVQPAADEERRLGRAICLSLVILTVLTAVMTMPPLLGGPGWDGGWLFRSMLTLTLIPQALPIVIPPAVCIGILYAMRGHRVMRRDLFGVLMFGLLASAVVWALMEWGIPAGNQAFRQLVTGQLSGRQVHLEPGLNELGLSHLGQRTDARAVAAYHLFWALSFASVPLSMLALSLAPHIRRAFPAVLFALTALVAYYVALRVSDGYLRVGVPLPLLTAWAPNALCLLAAFTVTLKRRAI